MNKKRFLLLAILITMVLHAVLGDDPGESTLIGAVRNFGAGESSPTELAVIGCTLYMAGYDQDAFYVLTYE